MGQCAGLLHGLDDPRVFCGQALAQETEPTVTDPHFKIAPGYLKQPDLPDSLMLLGSPPETGSAALARDEEARKATIPGSPRRRSMGCT
ncbi:hypothetical protein AB4144_55050, partial [Rhizobiaceae sp. 2RAB30]